MQMLECISEFQFGFKSLMALNDVTVPLPCLEEVWGSATLDETLISQSCKPLTHPPFDYGRFPSYSSLQTRKNADNLHTHRHASTSTRDDVYGEEVAAQPKRVQHHLAHPRYL